MFIHTFAYQGVITTFPRLIEHMLNGNEY